MTSELFIFSKFSTWKIAVSYDGIIEFGISEDKFKLKFLFISLSSFNFSFCF